MDLELRTVGRAARPLEAEFVRNLELSDLALLELEKGSKPSPLKRIRDSHHQLARVLAKGAKPAEASIICGISVSRISILQADPAFSELLAFYRANEDAASAELSGRLSTLSLTAAQILQERMEENPEDVGNSTLLETIKVTADRTGHGPQSRNVNVNVNVELASRLEAARRRAGLLEPPPSSPGPIVEGEFEEIPEAAE